MATIRPSLPRPLLLTAALAAVLASGGPSLAQSSPTAAELTGAKLKDAKGAPVGQIEKVIANAEGQPRQAVVRVSRVLRVLPIDALSRSGDGYATVLTRAELEALPPAE